MPMKTHFYLLLALGIAASTPVSGQAPIISSFAPLIGPVGDTVIITGSGFEPTPPDNIVYFGATKASVLAASPTELSVVVPLGATYQPITVSGFGQTAYSSTPFILTFPGNRVIDPSSFAEKTNFVAGSNPFELAVADLDGDGKTDLVTTNGLGNEISIYKSTATSGAITAESFASKLDVATGYGPRGLAIADIDVDGKPDIITISNGTTLVIFRNTSTAGTLDGTSFAPGISYLLGFGIALTNITVADFDMDGRPDLAVTEQMHPTVLVYKNTSTPGTIDEHSLAAPVSFTTGERPMGVAAGDLDGDQKAEIIVANNNSGDTWGTTISILRNTSSSGVIDVNSFASKVDFTTGLGPLGIAIGDLDGDAKYDLAVTNYASASVSIFKNTSEVGVISSASFKARVDFATETGPQSIALGDLDGDGKPDLAVANFSPNVTDATANTVSVLRNTSVASKIDANSFSAPIDFKAGLNPVAVVLGDFDGDKLLDIAVANYNDNSISVLRNKDDQTITEFGEITSKNMGDPSFTVSATASSGLPVQFTTSSDKIIITGNEISIVRPGSVTVSAGQPGNNTFSAAPKAAVTFCINPAKPTLTLDITDTTKPKLTSSSDEGNQWYLNGTLIVGATGRNYVVKDKGVYTANVVIDGCASPISESQTFIVTEDQGPKVGTAVLSPNPAHNTLSVRLHGFIPGAAVNVALIDARGGLISNHTAYGEEELNIDVGNFSEGLYIVTMVQGNVRQQTKFIKK